MARCVGASGCTGGSDRAVTQVVSKFYTDERLRASSGNDRGEVAPAALSIPPEREEAVRLTEGAAGDRIDPGGGHTGGFELGPHDRQQCHPRLFAAAVHDPSGRAGCFELGGHVGTGLEGGHSDVRPDRGHELGAIAGERSQAGQRCFDDAATPRQPAWIAATAPLRTSPTKIGTQSAVRTAQAIPGTALKIASPSRSQMAGRSGPRATSSALTSSATLPCTCERKARFASGTPSTRAARERFSLTSSGSSPTAIEKLRDSKGPLDTPPRRVKKACRKPAARSRGLSKKSAVILVWLRKS
jgi:hypothetical protein